MPIEPKDPELWMDELPLERAAEVVVPQRYESHVDSEAHARMTVGFDPAGRRCYLQHQHTEIEQRFDVDEFPLEVPVGRQRRIAWRLRQGGWLLQVDTVERLESCRPRVLHASPVVVREDELGF